MWTTTYRGPLFDPCSQAAYQAGLCRLLLACKEGAESWPTFHHTMSFLRQTGGIVGIVDLVAWTSRKTEASGFVGPTGLF